jgi:hypothetical protein
MVIRYYKNLDSKIYLSYANLYFFFYKNYEQL